MFRGRPDASDEGLVGGEDGRMQIAEFQRVIEAIYYEKDKARGAAGTFQWFVEEVGELARALREGEGAEEELADVLAWLSTLASIHGVELEEAVRKYAGGCPKCRSTPCRCEG
jgi:NTP pyrophosphatase (non-canonical NTP hydrolase)